MTDEILVFPRALLAGLPSYLRMTEVMLAKYFAENGMWMPRQEAEEAPDVVQPIPSAYVRNGDGDILLLHRVNSARKDMRSRLSLVVGGHVDYLPGAIDAKLDVASLFRQTLKREIQEELRMLEFRTSESCVLVIDRSSDTASRHVAFVYEVQADSEVDVSAPEEFSSSSVLSGRYIPRTKLKVFWSELDPWSGILLLHHFKP